MPLRAEAPVLEAVCRALSASKHGYLRRCGWLNVHPRRPVRQALRHGMGRQNSLIRSETNPLVRLRPSWVSAKKMPQNFDAGFLKNYGESAAQRFRPRMPRCSTSCRASKPKHLINVTRPTIYSRSSCLTKYFSLKTNHGITYTTLVFDNIAKLHTSRQLNGRLWLEIKLFSESLSQIHQKHVTVRRYQRAEQYVTNENGTNSKYLQK